MYGLIAYVYDPTRGRKRLVVYSVIHVQINYIVIKYNHYKKLYSNNLKVKYEGPGNLLLSRNSINSNDGKHDT